MSEAERIVEVTRRMHVIASTAEGATLTLAELERMAESEHAKDESTVAEALEVDRR
jgi:hypothetical protein